MTTEVNFRSYQLQDKQACLKIFDENSPKFFAANEYSDYADFLDTNPIGYEVCILDNSIVGAFGLIGVTSVYKSINWIMISPNSHGLGVGSLFMKRAISLANDHKLNHIKIAASHLSAPFFAKYGAISIGEIENGWGPNMHRVDMELHL